MPNETAKQKAEREAAAAAAEQSDPGAVAPVAPAADPAEVILAKSGRNDNTARMTRAQFNEIYAPKGWTEVTAAEQAVEAEVAAQVEGDTTTLPEGGTEGGADPVT